MAAKALYRREAPLTNHEDTKVKGAGPKHIPSCSSCLRGEIISRSARQNRLCVLCVPFASFALTRFGEETVMAQLGTGKYTYEVVHDFFKLPAGETFGMISRVAAD